MNNDDNKKIIFQKIKPSFSARNFYYKGREKVLYEDGKLRYFVNFHTKGVTATRLFDTFEEADAFYRICKENIARYKFKKSNEEYVREVNEVLEYPENLLKEIGFTDDKERFEILPNFEFNYAKVKKRLTPREEDIIDMRFRQEKTLQEVGKECGVTRERIRQLENRALRKLRIQKNEFYNSEEKLYLLDKEKEEEIIEETKKRMNRKYVLEYIKENLDDELLDEINLIIGGNNSNSSMSSSNSDDSDDSEVPIQDVNSISLNELNLSTRPRNALRRLGFTKVGDLPRNVNFYMRVRNLGKKSINEIVSKLNSLGIKIDETDEIDEIDEGGYSGGE